MNETDKVTEEFNQTAIFNTNKRNVSYTLPDVLDYLQAEWARMEMERAEWDVERAELQTKIAFLQSECKGQENLKSDLVRRIKMLEYALIQERNKNYKLKYPNREPAQLPSSPPLPVGGLDSEEANNRSSTVAAARWLEERTRLKTYLINAGLGDAMSQLCQARVRELLELTDSDSRKAVGTSSAENLSVEPDPTGSSQVFAARIDENMVSSKSSHSGESLSKMDEIGASYLSMLPKHHTQLDASDPETADALAEFELLLAQQARGDRECFDSTIDASKLQIGAASTEWDQFDETELLKRFKEQYRSDRIKAQSPHLAEASANALSLSPVEGCGDARVDEVDEGAVSLPFLDYDVKRPTPRFTADATRRHQKSTGRGGDGEEGGEPVATADAVWFDFKINLGAGEQQQPTRVSLKSSHTPISVGGDPLNQALTSATASARSPSPTQVPETLGLGDLGNLTVANEAPTESSSLVNQRREAYEGENTNGIAECASGEDGTGDTPLLWTPKYTLRSHFDGVRAISFHPTEPILVTCSEDHTLKLWNLNKTVQTKKSSILDVEPLYTFRGHNSPVLSMATWVTDSDIASHPPSPMGTSIDCPVAPSPSPSSCGFTVYSGDLTGHLRMWYLPNILQIDPYDTYDAAVMGPTLNGHTDAIWALDIQPNGLLLSASADGTACLWWPCLPTANNREQETHAPVSVYHLTTSLMTASRSIADFASTAPVPTTAVFLQHTNNHHHHQQQLLQQHQQQSSLAGKWFASGFTTGHICLFDIETTQLVTTFRRTTSSGESRSGQVGSVTCLVSHPIHPWVISGHDDCSIRIYDVNSGLCVHSMVAHLDTVTAMSLSSPQGSHLLSASHDCSIRLWDLQKKTCVQEITSHRRKCGESVNTVAFHPLLHFMASGGADALVKVFV